MLLMIVFFYFLAPAAPQSLFRWEVTKRSTSTNWSTWTLMRERALILRRHRPPVTGVRIKKFVFHQPGGKRFREKWYVADVSYVMRKDSTMRSGAFNVAMPPGVVSVSGGICALNIIRAALCAGPGTLVVRTRWGRTKDV